MADGTLVHQTDGHGGTARPSFLVLLAVPPVRLSDVRWLAPRDPDDPAAQLDADLRRDGQRRRWLSAPADVVRRYADELAAESNPHRRAGLLRRKVEQAERRAKG